jgi:hypothetical protein
MAKKFALAQIRLKLAAATAAFTLGAQISQIDPAWYIGLGHAIAPADVFDHTPISHLSSRTP